MAISVELIPQDNMDWQHTGRFYGKGPPTLQMIPVGFFTGGGLGSTMLGWKIFQQGLKIKQQSIYFHWVSRRGLASTCCLDGRRNGGGYILDKSLVHPIGETQSSIHTITLTSVEDSQLAVQCAGLRTTAG